MFETLIVSRPPAGVGARRYLAALGIHCALAVAAVKSAGAPAPGAPEQSFELLITIVAPGAVGQPKPPPGPDLPREPRPGSPEWAAAIEAPDVGPLALSTAGPTIASMLGRSMDAPGAAPAHTGLGNDRSVSLGPEALGPAPVDVPVEVTHQPVSRYPTPASVLAARYTPARLRGRPVRQLVRQTLSFRPDH